MAYDETLAARIRDAFGPRTDLREQKMFGGLAFMVGSHMCCGIVGDELMLRVGAGAEELLEKPHVRPMDFTGRPMKGFVFVSPEGVATDATLEEYVERALAFVGTLPPKSR